MASARFEISLELTHAPLGRRDVHAPSGEPSCAAVSPPKKSSVSGLPSTALKTIPQSTFPV